MTRKNSALDDNNPHVSIGWSILGDLTNIKTKEELYVLHKKSCPDSNIRQTGSAVGQIWSFIRNINIGDIIIYFDGKNAHFGEITSKYYYSMEDTSDDPDYVNKRNVKWLKSINYKELPSDFKSSGAVKKTIFSLNNYKSFVNDVLSGKDIVIDELDEYYDVEDVDTRDKNFVNKELKKNFKEWLTSNNNPDYTGRELYKGYVSCLINLLKKGYELNVFEVSSLSELKLSNIDVTREIYLKNSELIQYDHEKLQHSAGIAALDKYKKFLLWLRDNKIEEEIKENNIIKSKYTFSSEVSEKGRNIVVYGTPGCGKSYYVKNNLLKDYKDENVIRTTFYQDYTNTDFVGQIMPTLKKDEKGNDIVSYTLNPGPFTLALEKAIANPNEYVALVIEELNRGNAPSIFGDIFQLLDRKKGISDYSIVNVNIQKYLNKRFDEYIFENILLPSNLNIIATMNTTDQNVFTLDTAFKRRWEFIKISNSFKNHPYANMYIPGMQKDLKEFIEAINNFILNDENLINQEDKQLGVYFIDKDCLRSEITDVSSLENIKKFAFKVFEYLWDDITKFDNKSNWFKDAKSLDELIDMYIEKGKENKGLEVFNNDIFKEK